MFKNAYQYGNNVSLLNIQGKDKHLQFNASYINSTILCDRQGNHKALAS